MKRIEKIKKKIYRLREFFKLQSMSLNILQNYLEIFFSFFGRFLSVLQVFVILMFFFSLYFVGLSLLNILVVFVIVILLIFLKRALRYVRKRIKEKEQESTYYIVYYLFITMIISNISIFIFFFLWFYLINEHDVFNTLEYVRSFFAFLQVSFFSFLLRFIFVIMGFYIFYESFNKYINPNYVLKVEPEEVYTEKDLLMFEEVKIIYSKVPFWYIYYNEYSYFIFIYLLFAPIIINNISIKFIIYMYIFTLFIIGLLFFSDIIYTIIIYYRVIKISYKYSIKSNPGPDWEELVSNVKKNFKQSRKYIRIDVPTIKKIGRKTVVGFGILNGFYFGGKYLWEELYGYDGDPYPPRTSLRKFFRMTHDRYGIPKIRPPE